MKMASLTAKASKLAAFILISTNAVIMVFSFMLFILSIWIIASPNTLIFAVQTFGTDAMQVLLTKESVNLSLGIGLAVISCFLFFISFMGFYGAITCSHFLLFMYAAFILLLLLLECAVIFYFSSDIREKGIRQQDEHWTHALRLTFQCCEVNNTMLNVNRVDVPWSCCGVQGYPNNCTASRTFKKDCQKTFTEWSEKYETAIYVGLAVVHVILLSCSLLRRACSASRSHT